VQVFSLSVHLFFCFIFLFLYFVFVSLLLLFICAAPQQFEKNPLIFQSMRFSYSFFSSRFVLLHSFRPFPSVPFCSPVSLGVVFHCASGGPFNSIHFSVFLSPFPFSLMINCNITDLALLYFLCGVWARIFL